MRRAASDKSPHGPTLIAGLGIEGVRCSLVVDSAVNGDVIIALFDRVLTLRPGDVVVLDNLSSDKSERVQAFIEAAGGALEYPSPYTDSR